jgi:hypothetical protein
VTDTDLSPSEEQRLRNLVQRAADTLDVAARERVPATLGRRDRRVVAVAAVVVLVVIAALAAFMARGRTQEVDTVSPTTVTADQQWRNESGPWRLPEVTSGLTVTHVYDAFNTSTPFLVSTDGNEDPRRWLAVAPVPLGDAAPGPVAESTTLPSGVVLRRFNPAPSDGAGISWIEAQDPNSGSVTTFAFHGVSMADAAAYAERVVDRAANLTDVAGVLRAVDDVRPINGLQRTWNPDPGAYQLGSEQLMGIILETTSPAGRAFRVSIFPTNMTAPAARISSTLRDRTTSPAVQQLTASSTQPTATPGPEIQAWAKDGTMITVTPETSTSGDDASVNSDMLRILRSLRSMTKTQFDSELDRRGIERGATTTTTP